MKDNSLPLKSLLRSITPLAAILSMLTMCTVPRKNGRITYELNARFDSLVIADTTVDIIRTNEFPESQYVNKKVDKAGTAQLKYSPDKELTLFSLLEVLDAPKYTEKAKIDFIKDALADTSRNAFLFLNHFDIDFWRTSPEATQLIEGYFKRMAFEKNGKPYEYFAFRTKSLYPEAYQLISDYIARRDTLKNKYEDEGDLVYRLAVLGKEDEAVKFLDILVDDLISGKIEHIDFGESSNENHKPVIFEVLCLSDNADITRQASDVLFKLLNYKHSIRSEFERLAFYLDPKRYAALIDKWYNQYYAPLDFTVLDAEELRLKGWWGATKEKLPNATAYIGFMKANCAYLGKKYGKAFWDEFHETSGYTRYYSNDGRFELYALNVLDCVFKNDALTNDDRKAILFQAVPLLTFNDSDSRNWFLSLVKQACPDQKISREDFDKLQLGRAEVEYTYPLTISSGYGKPAWMIDIEGRSVPQNRDSLVAGLNTFARENQMIEITMNKRKMFDLSFKTADMVIYDFFDANTRMTWFDAESAAIPINYVRFFEREFQKILINAGYNFEISQQTRKIGEDRFSYDIYLEYKDIIYKHSYTDDGTDWYDPQRLVKMINRCLIDSKETDRLVEIDNEDQSAVFVLGTPGILKPFLNKYGVQCWAMHYADKFHGQQQ